VVRRGNICYACRGRPCDKTSGDFVMERGGEGCVTPLKYTSGWWFGAMEFYDFPYIGNNTPMWRTPSFFRGVGLNHQPDVECILIAPKFEASWLYTSVLHISSAYQRDVQPPKMGKSGEIGSNPYWGVVKSFIQGALKGPICKAIKISNTFFWSTLLSYQ